MDIFLISLIMKLKKRIKPILTSIILLLLISIFISLLLNQVLSTKSYKERFTQHIESIFKKKVFIEKAGLSISIWDGIGVRLSNFIVSDINNINIIFSKELILTFKFFPLLTGNLLIDNIIVIEPLIFIEDMAKYNDVILGKEHPSFLEQQRLTIRDGRILIADDLRTGRHQSLLFEKLNLIAKRKKRVGEDYIDIRLDSELALKTYTTKIYFNGMIKGLKEHSIDFRSVSYEGNLKITSLDMGMELIRTSLPLEDISGNVDIDIFLKLSPNKSIDSERQSRSLYSLHSSGNIVFNLMNINYSRFFINPLRIHGAFIFFDLDIKGDSALINRLSLNLKEITLEISGSLDKISSKNKMLLNLQANTGRFSLTDIKRYLPHRLLPYHVSDFIGKDIKKGMMQIKHINFNGNMEQLVNIANAPEYFALLSAEIAIANISFNLSTKRLFFLSNGNIKIDNGSVILSNLSGKYGSVTINKMAGNISDIITSPLLTLSIFSEIKFNDIDIKDILPMVDFFPNYMGYINDIKFIGGSAVLNMVITSRLKQTNDSERQGRNLYPFSTSLTGSIMLNNINLSYKKAVLPFKNINTNILLSDDKWKIEDRLSGWFGNSRFWFKGGITNPLSQNAIIDINGEANLDAYEFSKDIFKIDKLMMYGEYNILIRIKGSYNRILIDTSVDLNRGNAVYSNWLAINKGANIFMETSILVDKDHIMFDPFIISIGQEKIFAILEIKDLKTKKINFKMNAQKFKVEVLAKVFTFIKESKGLKGTISFNNINLSIFNKEERKIVSVLGAIDIDLQGIWIKGFPHPFKELKGKVLINEERITASELMLRSKNSLVVLKGKIEDINKPDIYVDINSPVMYLDDFLLKDTLSLHGDRRSLFMEPSYHPVFKLNGKIVIDDFYWRGAVFNALNGNIFFENNEWRLIDFDAKGMEGMIKLEGKISMDNNKRFNFSLRSVLDSINIERLALFINKQFDNLITGVLALKLDIKARGSNKDDILQNTSGTINMEANNGVINRSKIITEMLSSSISAEIKERLKDKLKDKKDDLIAIPFDIIKCNFKIKNGSLSVDESCYMEGKTTKISAVGNINIMTGDLDIKTGFQPLAPIDRIISNIPLVGNILTGKEKSLMIRYFSITGNISKPIIKEIPPKSLGERVLDIFKRILKTPKELLSPIN